MNKIILEDKFEASGAEIKLREDNIIYFFAKPTFTLEENVAETKWITSAFENLSKKFPEMDFYVLMDVTEVGNSEQISEETRKAYVELIKNPRLKKIGVFGQTWGFQLIIDLIGALSKSKKLKSFKTEEKALEWLKQNK